MHVHAAPCHVGIGLRHECGFKPALVRDAFDDSLEPNRLVAGEARIRHVSQIDFPLVRAVLRERRAGRHVLFLAGRRDLREDVGDGLEIGHGIDLRPVLAPSGQPRFWRLGVAVGPSAPDRRNRTRARARRRASSRARRSARARGRARGVDLRRRARRPRPASAPAIARRSDRARARRRACAAIGRQGQSSSPSSNPRPVDWTVPPRTSSANIEAGRNMPCCVDARKVRHAHTLAAQDAAQIRHQKSTTRTAGCAARKASAFAKSSRTRAISHLAFKILYRVPDVAAGQDNQPPVGRARFLRCNIIRPETPLRADRTRYSLPILRGASPPVCETMDPVEQASIPGAVQNN